MNYQSLTLPALATLLFAVICGFGYSSGPTQTTGMGYTGAPTAAGGTEGVCGNCHRGGSYGEPVLNVTFAEADSDVFDTLVSYVPGQTYRVSIAVGYGSEAPASYGFQAQFLTDAEAPEPAGILSDPADGIGISEGSGTGRSYAEQRRSNTDSTFLFSWTAPAAGTGPVNLHAVGNLVNGMGNTGGDNGSTSALVVGLQEGTTTSVRSLTRLHGNLSPNPLFAGAQVQLTVGEAKPGTYLLSVSDLSGRVLQRNRLVTGSGPLTRNIDTQRLHPGIYLVTLDGPDSRYAERLVVR